MVKHVVDKDICRGQMKRNSLKCAVSVSGGLGDMISQIPIFSEFSGFIVVSDLYKELFSLYEFDILWWKEKTPWFENVLRLSLEIRRRNPEFTYGMYPNGRRINIILFFSPGIKVYCDDGNYSLKRLVSLLRFSPNSRPIYVPFGRRESYVSINSKILGVKPRYPFDLREKEEYAAEAEKFAREPYAVIHPTAKYITKRWNLTKFINVSKKIIERDLRVVFVLGEGEKDVCARISSELAKEIKDKKVFILYGESITKIISYVKRASFFLGNDSAIAHIAGVSGVKTFAIYGYTRHYHTSPVNSEVIRLELPCSPCYNFAKGEKAVSRECKYDFACLKKIDEQVVWEKVKNFIDEKIQRKI